MLTLAKRIEDAQLQLVQYRDQLQAHLDSSTEMDDAATATTEELTAQIEAKEKNVEALKKAEAQLARATRSTSLTVIDQTDVQPLRPTARGASNGQGDISPRGRLFAVPAQKITPFDCLIKGITVDLKHFAEGRKRGMLDVLKETYGDNELGETVRTIMGRMVTKAAVIPADTTTSGWADSLVQTVIQGFISALMPYSVYPALAARGASYTFGRNGVISIPGRNSGTPVGGAFVAQGGAIPVKQGAFTAVTMTPKKMGVITTMTREITEHSTPAIEGILRQAILEDTAVAIDTVLLDATAATTTRPAGLKNGITKVNASSATPALSAFIADLRNLVAALITATNGNIRAPVWIMNPGDVLASGLLQTTTGDTPYREELSGGTLLGYPIVASTTGLNDMMGIIDAADFATATGDTPQFSVSDQAVLHMEDTSPAGISSVGTPNTVAAPVRSLWQTDSIAIRMILDINWIKRRTGIFQWTDTMTWN
jgi:HK97 family phage major capsid protein